MKIHFRRSEEKDIPAGARTDEVSRFKAFEKSPGAVNSTV